MREIINEEIEKGRKEIRRLTMLTQMKSEILELRGGKPICRMQMRHFDVTVNKLGGK